MLRHLDAVPWSDLTHAYGSAADVPGQLRAVADGTGDPEPFFGSLWHQGTVYPATAPAVPFLAELAVGVPRHRATLLRLLAGMACGSGYHQVHDPLFRRVGVPDDHDLGPTLAQERRDVTAAHGAVCAAWPGLAGCLDDPDPAVREAALDVAGSVVGVGRVAADAVSRFLGVEGDPVLRGHGLRALIALAVRSAATEGWRLDPAEWPGSLGEADRGALVDRLAAESAGGRTPLERVLAADGLVTCGRPVARPAGELVADVVAADTELRGTYGQLFVADPALQLELLGARCRLPGEVPRDLLLDLRDLLDSRRVRPAAVALLVGIVTTSADAESRVRAASHLRHVGAALAPHADAVADAVAGDALLEALAARPLRRLGHPAGARFLEGVLRGADDVALLFLAELVEPGDPPAWRGLLAQRLAAVDRAANRLTGSSTFTFGHFRRGGGSSLSDTGQNLADRLERALRALDGAPEPAWPAPPTRPAAGVGWPGVRALEAAWREHRDPAALLAGVVEQLAPQPSGLAASKLAAELPLGDPALDWVALRDRVDALLAEDDALGYGTIEEDELFLARLRQVRARL
jgi:hypothetical protein